MTPEERKLRARNRARRKRGWYTISAPREKNARPTLATPVLGFIVKDSTSANAILGARWVKPDATPEEKAAKRKANREAKEAKIQAELQSIENQPTLTDAILAAEVEELRKEWGFDDEVAEPALTPAQMAAIQTVEPVPVAEPEHALTPAQILGAKGGKVRSERKTKAARENAKKPRKKKG